MDGLNNNIMIDDLVTLAWWVGAVEIAYICVMAYIIWNKSEK
jgi:hypothetical protein